MPGCQSAPRPEAQVRMLAAATGRLFIGAPPALRVDTPPPLALAEAAPLCAPSDMVVPGQWDWNGAWRWIPALCVETRPGYEYIPPTYTDGVYLRGHFAKSTSDRLADEMTVQPGARSAVTLLIPPGTSLRPIEEIRRERAREEWLAQRLEVEKLQTCSRNPNLAFCPQKAPAPDVRKDTGAR